MSWLYSCLGASLVAQTVKSPPAVQETQVQSLGREDPLEKEIPTLFPFKQSRGLFFYLLMYSLEKQQEY